MLLAGRVVATVVHRRRFVQVGLAALGLALAGFAATGLSRLVIADETAMVLGAPLLFAGFALAAVAFVLAVLVRGGVVELEE